MQCPARVPDAVVRSRAVGSLLLVLGVSVVLALVPSPLEAQPLQPCCQGSGGSFCVLPWSTGQQDCEDQGGMLFQANTCTAGNECAVDHSVPARGMLELEIDLIEEGSGGTGETVPVEIDDIDTLVLRMDPTCFTPPQAGTDCTIDVEIIALSLQSVAPVTVVLDEHPNVPSLGQIGPVITTSVGCFLPPAASFFQAFVEIDLPSLDPPGQALVNPPRIPLQLEGEIGVGGADCTRPEGELILVEPVPLVQDLGLPEVRNAPGSRDPEALIGAQTAVGGAINSMVVTFPQLSVLEIPALSTWGLLLLSAGLAAAAWIALSRR